jgi:PilZ domain
MTENRDRSAEPRGTQSSSVASPSGAPTTRRSARIPLVVPILLIGSNSEGKVFTEKTQTVVVSLHGAGILSRNTLVAEQILILREEATNREAEIRVVGEIGKQGKLYAYGAAFVDETLHFWRMDFPAEAANEQRPATLLLECSGCGDVVELENGDYEYDICMIHGGLARYCGECGLLTVWRRTQKAVRTKRGAAAESWKTEAALATRTEEAALATTATQPAPVTMAQAVVATKTAVAETAAERRIRVRAKVNFFACVRTEEFGDDVVTCVDMSKGGVSFRGEHSYTKDMKLQIAVPFAKNEPGATPLFVRGRIANVREERSGVLRCGVEFLRG